VLAFAMATGVSACGYGRRGFYEYVPERQYRITIEEGARDALLQFVSAFAEKHSFSIVRESMRSAPSAPSVMWVLEQFKGMIVFQNKIVGEEPDPQYPDLTLRRHSQTDFRAWFYRSMFGYSDQELDRLISAFGSELAAVDGVIEFVDQFPRAAR